jgi:hypothetical protein
VFDDPSVSTFAVKTLKKSQQNVETSILENEILSLITIQRAQNLNQKLENSVIHLYEVYECSKYVHLVLENTKGCSLLEAVTSDDRDQQDIILNHEFQIKSVV